MAARIKELEDAIRDVVTQQGDDLCWRDVYTNLAKLVGVDFDPTLIDDCLMLRNCKAFITSLHGGEPYKMTGAVGKYSVESLLHLSCGHCDKWWSVAEGDPEKHYFCPHCGKQQSFDKAPSI